MKSVFKPPQDLGRKMNRVCPMNRLGNFSSFLWGKLAGPDKVEHDLKSPANGDSVTLAGIPQRPVA